MTDFEEYTVYIDDGDYCVDVEDFNGSVNVKHFKSKGKCAKWVKSQIILFFQKMEESK